MLVEAKYVVKYTEDDGWSNDTWEGCFETEAEARQEVACMNRPGNLIQAEYLGLKIIGN